MHKIMESMCVTLQTALDQQSTKSLYLLLRILNIMTVNIPPHNSKALKIFRLTKFGKPSTLRSELAFSELLIITVCTGLIILVSKAKLCGGLRRQRCSV